MHALKQFSWIDYALSQELFDVVANRSNSQSNFSFPTVFA